MIEEKMNYPLHLGVTEAGEAEDGRIKSAVGIGTLLEDGLGDTIRVSLTEEPEKEIPVARIMVDRYVDREDHQPIWSINSLPYDPFFYRRMKTDNLLNFGNNNFPRVIGDLSTLENISHSDFNCFGYLYSKSEDKWHVSEQAVDYLYIGRQSIDFEIPGTLGIIQDQSSFIHKDNYFPLYSFDEKELIEEDQYSFLQISSDISKDEIVNLNLSQKTILIFETNNQHGVAALRRLFIELIDHEISNPIIVKLKYSSSTNDEFLINASTDFGGLQLDGFGDGIWIKSDCNSGFINETAFGILQACRTRISKTEYISCPSCGRTLFDLQDTTAKIRDKTDHLKGIKIGIMGCIVNGPGEMADADYGYVGTGVGKISLYKGQNVIQRNIPEELAVDALISLIDSNGDWIDPDNV